MVKSNQVDRHERLSEEKTDWQWVNLLMEARNLGLSPSDVRMFLQTATKKET